MEQRAKALHSRVVRILVPSAKDLKDPNSPASKSFFKTVKLAAGVTFNLAVLGFFKYSWFIASNIAWLVGAPAPFAPIVLPLAISFVTLYLVMSRLAVPRIEDTLAKRQAKIQGDLDAAEKANEETRALVAAYEQRLADAREDARRLQREQGELTGKVAAAIKGGSR